MPPSATPHWRGLDGLRGIAVLAVVLFHADVGLGVNGFVGVDIFFALSGFLITSLLLDEHRANGRISLGRFAMRRVLRLYPALIMVCLVVLALSVPAHRVSEAAAAVGAGLLYLSNWWLYSGHDMGLLNHLWTLAIEEHFYLVWPTLLSLGLSARRRYRATAVVAVLAAVVLLLMPWPATITAVKDSYVRGAPILFGCALAFVLRSSRARRALSAWAPALAAVGSLVVVVISVFPTTLPIRFLEGFSSLPGWAAAAVIVGVVLTPDHLTVRWLATGALTWCGRRAYGIYLIHFPVLSLMAHQVAVPSSHLARAAIGVVLSLALAAISYRLVEMPFLRMKASFEPRRASSLL